DTIKLVLRTFTNTPSTDNRTPHRQDFKDQHRPLVGNATDQVVDQGLNTRVEMVRGSLGGVRLRLRDLLLSEVRHSWHFFLHSLPGTYGTFGCLLSFGECKCASMLSINSAQGVSDEAREKNCPDNRRDERYRT